MKPQIPLTEQSQPTRIPSGSLSPLPPSPSTQRTQFIVILDATGKPIALAPMEQLRKSSISPERIRIVQGQEELSKIWK